MANPPEPSAYIEVTETVAKGEKRCRKRCHAPEKWQRNVQKLRRNTGEEYTCAKKKNKPQKNVPSRVMKPVSCGGKKKPCHKNCPANFSDDQRLELYTEYWKLKDNNEKNQFLARCVEIVKPNRKRLETLDVHRKKVRYFMTVAGQRKPCCKNFLVTTLGIGKRKVDYLLKNLNPVGIPKPDQRGKTKEKHADETVIQTIRDHISSFPTIPSHYCRRNTKYKDSQDACSKGYVPPEWHRYYTSLPTTDNMNANGSDHESECYSSSGSEVESVAGPFSDSEELDSENNDLESIDSQEDSSCSFSSDDENELE